MKISAQSTCFFQRVVRAITRSLSICLSTLVISLAASAVVVGQSPATAGDAASGQGAISPAGSRRATDLSVKPESWVSDYVDPAQGASSVDLVRCAVTSNAELAAARLEIERARARLRQAGLRPNPTIDFEQTTGRLTGSAGERETTVGFAWPLELGGKRQRRVDLARAELEAAEAEVADRERRLTAEVRTAYAEAMAARRELEITRELNNLDLQTARVVEARVSEGDAAPLELSLLRVEVDRLRARRALVEGRLQAALLRLKSLAGIPPIETLRLREDLTTPVLPEPPASLDAALEIALRTRPDLRLARLTEEVAQAGLRLARAQATPDVTAFSRYTVNRSVFDQTPVGALRDRDKLLTFGVSISIPIFNRHQGAQAEAATAITQAQRRRQFVEAVVRAEVTSAYARYAAATKALATFEQGVIARSNENIRAIRGAYQIGAFRVTELLTEQRRLVDSQREYTEALAERYRALADLQSAIGVAVNPTEKQNEE
jgi:cobalt-zinc-cadmium efflux system outer membrane protein